MRDPGREMPLTGASPVCPAHCLSAPSGPLGGLDGSCEGRGGPQSPSAWSQESGAMVPLQTGVSPASAGPPAGLLATQKASPSLRPSQLHFPLAGGCEKQTLSPKLEAGASYLHFQAEAATPGCEKLRVPTCSPGWPRAGGAIFPAWPRLRVDEGASSRSCPVQPDTSLRGRRAQAHTDTDTVREITQTHRGARAHIDTLTWHAYSGTHTSACTRAHKHARPELRPAGSETPSGPPRSICTLNPESVSTGSLDGNKMSSVC